MRDQVKYQIQPEILEFMRKSSGMSEEEIAKKLKFSKSKYISIEDGTEKILPFSTIEKANLIAEVWK